MEINWQNVVDEYIESERREVKKMAANEFRPSSLNGCVRQTLKGRVGLSVYGKETMRHFQIGTLLHRFIQSQASLGNLSKCVEFEKKVEFEYEGIKFVGHVDCYDGEFIYDFKTTSNLATTLAYETSLAYRMQLGCYAHALKSKKTLLVYIDKRTLEISQKQIEPVPIQDIIEFVKKVMKAEEEYSKTNLLPAKDGCWLCSRENIDSNYDIAKKTLNTLLKKE